MAFLTYIITLTDSTGANAPRQRIKLRASDEQAIDLARRELRLHRHSLGSLARYDGWTVAREVGYPGRMSTVASGGSS